MAAHLRAGRAEASALAGKATGAILWDLTSYFDTIVSADIVAECEATNYPPRHLWLALVLHLSGRILTDKQCAHHAPVRVTSSIMAGFVDSVPLTKLLMTRPLSQLKESVPSATIELHVDEKSQQVCGTPAYVEEHLLRAGLHLATTFQQRQLRVSVKSTVVASSVRIARRIAHRMQARRGTEHQACSHLS